MRPRVEPILRVIGSLPPGTPAAFEARSPRFAVGIRRSPRRGKKIATTAAARKLLTRAWFDTADGRRLVLVLRWQGDAEFVQKVGELALFCRRQPAEDVPLVGEVLRGSLVN